MMRKILKAFSKGFLMGYLGVDAVQEMTLRPGGLLIVRVKERLSQEHLVRIEQRLRDLLGDDFNAIVIDCDAEITAINVETKVTGHLPVTIQDFEVR
jgi:hypothetical protein